MRDLVTLLMPQAYEGYPTEYLLARIRGRRAALVSVRPWAGAGGEPTERAISPGAAGGVTGSEARAQLKAELRWVYRQMNRGLRRTFAPLFLWLELRTILLAVRFRRGGERERSVPLLAASLLGEGVLRVLSIEGEPAAVIDALAILLATIDEPYRELGTIYRQRGGRAWEQRLVTLYLERMTGPQLHPVLAEFFRGMIDLRNLVTLAKQLRWDLRDPQGFVPGGKISLQRLHKARTTGTPAALAVLFRSLSGMSPLAEVPANPEPLLFAWLTRKVRLLSRETGGIGLILDYFWWRFVDARNVGLLFHGMGLEGSTLRTELIG